MHFVSIIYRRNNMALLKESRELTNGIFFSWQDWEVIGEFRKDREKLLITSSSFRKALKDAIASDKKECTHDGVTWFV